MHVSSPQRRIAPGRFTAVALLFVASLLAPGVANAVGSAPLLAITTANVLTTPGGVRSVTITGTFNFDDLLQFSFPAGMIVTQGAHFVRYDLNGQMMEGTDAIVADGITAPEVATMLTLGATAGSPAEVTQLRVDRISVALPADFTAGAASVVLYAMFDGESFVSNTVAIVLP